MDIAALSTTLSMINTQSTVGTQVLAMSMDEMQEEGSAMTKMLEMSVAPHIGGNIDVSV